MEEIQIIIKGGEELGEYYPRNYEAFEEKIGDLILVMFPGVSGWGLSSEPTDRHKAQKEAREKAQAQRDKERLSSMFQEPEIRAKLQSICAAAPAGN